MKKSQKKKGVNGNGDAEHWILRLYIAGQTPKSVAALSNLNEICEARLKGQYEIESSIWLANLNWRAKTRSLPYPLWFDSCPSLYGRSLAIYPINNAS